MQERDKLEAEANYITSYSKYLEVINKIKEANLTKGNKIELNNLATNSYYGYTHPSEYNPEIDEH